ncbi:MAG: HNH endonuclease [Desulfosporosinus sp.]|nr:HNH endonuclease [Desulfosporosinus sp.]
MFYNNQIDMSIEKWCELLADSSVTTDADFKVLKFIYEAPKHEASASEIASHLDIPHHGPINLQIGRFGKRISQKTGIEPSTREDGSIRWWHIPFLGYEKAGRFPWIMRQELVMAFEEIYGIEEDLNEMIYLDEDLLQDLPIFTEGLKKSILINRYERNRKARIVCLKHYGYKCVVYGFDFEKTYGPIGKNIIHIHHITPIAKIGHDYLVNPIQDLQPVCPNCHTVIHSMRDPFSIEEVKAILKGQSNDA